MKIQGSRHFIRFRKIAHAEHKALSPAFAKASDGQALSNYQIS